MRSPKNPDCRALATRVIVGVIQQHSSLATLLPEALAQVKDNDRALLQELCYGTLRHFYSLNALISQCLSKNLREKDHDIHAVLLIGAYQLLFTRIPAYAAINSSVNVASILKKTWAKALINAVLRKVQNRTERLLSQAVENNDESRFDHPLWLIHAIQEAWPTQADAILTANNSRAPMTLRVNQCKYSREAYLQLLLSNSIPSRASDLSDTGIQLEVPVPVENLPGFLVGSVSVQDEAAQLCAGLLQVEKQHRVLDACAAPGGKTCHLLEQEPGLSLFAVDNDENRCHLIRENLQRLNLSAKVMAADATQPDIWWQPLCHENFFDRILLDAPCSATGVIRRHPDIKLLRRREDIPVLATTQLQLLRSLWPLLNPDGLLLYVTCSILPEENDRVIANFIATVNDAKVDKLVVPWGIGTDHGRQLLPKCSGHDGFYYSLLRKQTGP